MAWISQHKPDVVKEAGERKEFGEWPLGSFIILSCMTSSRNELAKKLVLQGADGFSIEVPGDIRDFTRETRALPFLDDGTFDVKNWKYIRSENERPQFVPVSTE